MAAKPKRKIKVVTFSRRRPLKDADNAGRGRWGKWEMQYMDPAPEAKRSGGSRLGREAQKRMIPIGRVRRRKDEIQFEIFDVPS